MVVPKPNGTIHLCIDFRKVNEIAKLDAYPMPQVAETLEKTGQAQYMSTLDPTKGYWQILLQEAQEKMAFDILWGLFEFKRTPFGLHGTTTIFQRLMDLRNAGLKANPSTCVLGNEETQHLVFLVHKGRIQPLMKCRL